MKEHAEKQQISRKHHTFFKNGGISEPNYT